jgi:hypothetical protein
MFAGLPSNRTSIMKKRNSQKLSLKKATLKNLSAKNQRGVKGGISQSCLDTCKPECYSPLCGPTHTCGDTEPTINAPIEN